MTSYCTYYLLTKYKCQGEVILYSRPAPAKSTFSDNGKMPDTQAAHWWGNTEKVLFLLSNTGDMNDSQT